ncbi:MAG: EamA family transporter, partial [Anaerolineae bacterium]
MLAWFPLAVLSAAGFGVSAFFMKLATLRSPQGRVFILMGLSVSATLIFTTYGLIQGVLEFSAALVALGVVMGLGTLLGNSCWVNAVAVGPASLTQALANTNTLLVVAMSLIFFNERLTVVEVAGVLVVVVAAALLAVDPNESISITDRRWYPLIVGTVLLLFFRVGGLKLADEFNLSSTTALALTYGVGIVWFGAAIGRG